MGILGNFNEERGYDMLLEVKNLNIEFHDHILPESVVDDVSFLIHEGEILGLVGESGSGKSMTALAIAGLLSRHDMKKTGEILFEGKELLTCPRGELRAIQGNEIGMIFQEPMTSLNPVKKIGWQVGESLRIHTELSKEEIKTRVLAMLKEVELEDPELVYEQYPHELSGGMRQRVMIASAMICRPKILIADEPTTALDVTIQAQILALIKRLSDKEGMAVLFISHDLSLVRMLCGRVIVMQQGRIIEEGETQQVFDHPEKEYTKLLISSIPVCERGRGLRFAGGNA
jgi:ABC-type dipeptide/oligopeptide/nickel transport system ATPase component